MIWSRPQTPEAPNKDHKWQKMVLNWKDHGILVKNVFIIFHEKFKTWMAIGTNFRSTERRHLDMRKEMKIVFAKPTRNQCADIGNRKLRWLSIQGRLWFRQFRVFPCWKDPRWWKQPEISDSIWWVDFRQRINVSFGTGWTIQQQSNQRTSEWSSENFSIWIRSLQHNMVVLNSGNRYSVGLQWLQLLLRGGTLPVINGVK